MKGIVIKSTGSWYNVLLDNENILECRIRGNIRLQGSRSTNPIAVGDMVEVEYEANSTNGVITDITDRKNYIIRKSINLSKKYHVLAANIDQMILLVTIHNPRTPYGFIDRTLTTAEAYHIQPIIIINKQDTWTSDKDKEYVNEMINTYKKVGYNVFAISALNRDDIKQVKVLMKGKVSMLIGHSGAGKSTLLNAVNPDLNIKTSTISDMNQTGKHTTTFAEMHKISKDTYVVDTPGIKEFGVIDLNKGELGHYFPEMRALLNQCRFNNCQHINEPGCAVKQAVQKEEIAGTRYRSYLSIMQEEAE